MSGTVQTWTNQNKELEQTTKGLLWRQGFMFWLLESGHLSISTHMDPLNLLSSLPNHCMNIILKPHPYFRNI